MKPGDRLLLAVSGGADSVAMLRVLLELRAELGIVLAVAHFNHGLRGEASEADQAFVEELARQHNLDVFAARQDVAAYALANRFSLEAAGRSLRHEWLAQLATEHKFNAVATAHTLDDQAETVLMKFLRGAGTKGLGGIYPEVDAGTFRFVRPLLTVSRGEIEAYLSSIEQPWREDESNLDRRFRRNRVRHELLPLLEKDYSPSVRQALHDAAEIARGEEAYWEAALDPLLGLWHDPPRRLRLIGFASMHLALQRRLLKRFLELEGVAFSFRHLERVRQCALGESPGCELPGGWMALVEGEHLLLRDAPAAESTVGYELSLEIGEQVTVHGMLIRAVPVPSKFAGEEAPGTLLRADALQGLRLMVRNWRPGDRYRPAYSGSEEKLKRMLAERRIPAAARPSWPVVVSGEEIVWVRDLPVAEAYCWHPEDGDAVKIECVLAVG